MSCAQGCSVVMGWHMGEHLLWIWVLNGFSVLVHSEAFYGAFRSLSWCQYIFNHHSIQFHDYIWNPHTVAEARLHAPIAVSGAPPSPESQDEKSLLFPSRTPDCEAARWASALLLAVKLLCPAWGSQEAGMYCVRGRATCKPSLHIVFPGTGIGLLPPFLKEASSTEN